MKLTTGLFAGATLCVMIACGGAFADDPQPKIVTALPGQPPSDAVVLLGASGLGEWTALDGSPAPWAFTNGVMTVTKGGMVTRREFGDIQLHVEWASPAPPKGTGQDRGNSGIYFQGAYEVQVLDSFQNETYTNGMAGAVYETAAPLVNAARPAGDWQVYDIVFRAPVFDSSGKVVKRPTITVFWNGVLVQDHTEVAGPTRAAIRTEEKPRGPIHLQDHGHPVKYRNIWVREL